MSLDDERRSAPRSPIAETLFIESISSSQISKIDQGKASAVNASSSGLQVELDFHVLEQAEIALWINGEDGERALISGTVRWVSDTDKDTYLVGIELDAESAPAIQHWLN